MPIIMIVHCECMYHSSVALDTGHKALLVRRVPTALCPVPCRYRQLRQILFVEATNTKIADAMWGCKVGL